MRLAMMTKTRHDHIEGGTRRYIGLNNAALCRVAFAPCSFWKIRWRSRWKELFRESSHDATAQQSCEHDNKQNPNDLQQCYHFQRWHNGDARARAERMRHLLPNPSKPASSSELSAKRSGSLPPKHSRAHRLPPILYNNTFRPSN